MNHPQPDDGGSVTRTNIALRRVEESAFERDDAGQWFRRSIVEAWQAGASATSIAEAAGLTTGRIYQITAGVARG